MFRNISINQVYDFIILLFRWYLAVYMVDYGWSKLAGGQFGNVGAEILEKPVKEVEIFYLAWYLFGSSKVFNLVVGLSQIIAALLLVINRTVLLGALMLVPILIQIFLVDVSFTMSIFGAALPVRIAGMLACNLAILYYYKEKIISAFWKVINIHPRSQYPWWLFPLLIPIGYLMDLVLAFLSWPINQLVNWLLR